MVEAAWREWSGRTGRDPEPILAAVHGRKIGEALREIDGTLDVAAEARVLMALEETHADKVRTFAGAAEVVAALPRGRWAVVTSGTRTVALGRLEIVGIAPPAVFITARDVREGKPAPEGYLLAARRLGVAPEDCLVLEDAPVGVAAGKAAGMQVVAVATTHEAERLGAADAVVESIAEVRIEVLEGELVLTLPAGRAAGAAGSGGEA